MNDEKGSTWNKWDFHVHTPYSILNNQYGFDPFDEGNESEFDKYVQTLFSKADAADVVAIGITDYFSIDGYKRIVENYLNKEDKMKTLFPNKKQREKIKKIFVFPNIEFRLNNFVGENCKSVNYHVFFSDKLSISNIEENFLHRIKITDAPNSTMSLTKNNIESFGKQYKKNNVNEKRSDYRVGCEQLTVSYEQILGLLNESSLFADKFFISIPVDEDLSKIAWTGRDYPTRQSLYKQCDFLMTSNPKTRVWALAEGHEKAQISEFGSIKPCIWGSDAHSYDRMFHPNNDKYCWIKANATFEGLRQVLYEPKDRVIIQKDKPEEKDMHQVIDHIIFKNSDFPDNPIFLSEGLTAIIGGKSTGKSILLRHIAKGVDSKQVLERESKAGITSKLDVDSETIWKDGVSGERKIIYIPQSWLNHLADDSTGDSQLNKMFSDILLQQPKINTAYSVLKTQVDEIIDSTKHDIIDYISCCNEIKQCEHNLNEFGRSEAFQSVIEKLEEQKSILSIESGINDDILHQYEELSIKITEQNKNLDNLKKESSVLENLQEPFVYLPQITNINRDGSMRYDLDNISVVKEKIEKTISEMNTMILEVWHSAISDMKRKISESYISSQEFCLNLQSDFEPLQKCISANDQFKKIELQIEEETSKFLKAKSFEDAKKKNIEKAEIFKQKILASRQQLWSAYNEFMFTVSEMDTSESELVFAAEINYRRKDLFDAIHGLFDNRGFRTFKEKYKYNFLENEEGDINDGLFDSIWAAMSDETLNFKGGNTTQTALERLFSDWYYIHYTVKSGNDTIDRMSPGKKALVLLEMIVNLEKSKCPILIDQPEDDLDNRSIYTDLVSYLKSKKHERQIIVVTHNANVVIGADAEEVIIANQDGKESPNNSKKFEYRTGAIENITPVLDSQGKPLPGVLNQKGIQEQICDILEGGKEAFELRRKKYIRE